MTDKIKSARELAQCGEWETLVTDYPKTILEALSAYEKLQGVDLDGMKKGGRSYIVAGTTKYNDHVLSYNQAIDDVKAQLVADIGGDG